jgi:multiple sugar transport system permease protein
MAQQLDSAAQLDQGVVGLDPSLTLPGDTGELIRKWGPQVVTIGALVLGGALAYGLSALNLNDGTSMSVSEVNKVLTFSTPSKGWFLPLSWFCALFAILVAFVMPEAERFARTVGSSLGAIGAMALPYYVATHQKSIDETASGVGAGMIAALICFAVAAVLPWISLLVINRERPLLGTGWSRWLFVGPAILWILLLTIFPLVYAFTTSRYGFRNGRVNRAVGWGNYKRAFDEPDWAHAFGVAAQWAAVGLVLVIVLGAILSFFANEYAIDLQAVRSVAGFIPVVVIPAFVIGFLTDALTDPLDNQLMITVVFVVCVVSAEMVLGVLFALLMNREIRGRGALRAILTLPLFAAPVGIGYLARTIFYEGGGPMDRLLGLFGVSPPPWLSDPTWAKISTMIVDVWQWTPFVFVIALAGLQGLPNDIVEAAQVDGASKLQVFRSITLPLLAPILWLILLLRTIDAFKVFDIVAAMTLGGPGRSTEYYSFFNYRTARKFFDYGYAAVQAFILLFVVAVVVSVLWGRIKGIYEEEVIRA